MKKIILILVGLLAVGAVFGAEEWRMALAVILLLYLIFRTIRVIFSIIGMLLKAVTVMVVLYLMFH